MSDFEATGKKGMGKDFQNKTLIQNLGAALPQSQKRVSDFEATDKKVMGKDF